MKQIRALAAIMLLIMLLGGPQVPESAMAVGDLIIYGDTRASGASINTTAKEAAAVVAFFNAQASDPTVIGIDSKGTDWKTAGYWATQRAQHGHPNPVGIVLWDFGNETYGGVQGSGPKCPDFGWEA